jgi:hypothetical protein
VRSRLAYVACHHDLHVESCRTDNRVAGPLELDDVKRTAVLEFDDMSTEETFQGMRVLGSDDNRGTATCR